MLTAVVITITQTLQKINNSKQVESVVDPSIQSGQG